MKKNISLKIITFGIFLLCASCYGDSMLKKNLEKIISENLQSGSSNDEIINFFEEQNWVYSFDRHRNRYQARNPSNNDPDVGYQIYIYVDQEKSFKHASVEKIVRGIVL